MKRLLSFALSLIFLAIACNNAVNPENGLNDKEESGNYKEQVDFRTIVENAPIVDSKIEATTWKDDKYTLYVIRKVATLNGIKADVKRVDSNYAIIVNNNVYCFELKADNNTMRLKAILIDDSARTVTIEYRELKVYNPHIDELNKLPNANKPNIDGTYREGGAGQWSVTLSYNNGNLYANLKSPNNIINSAIVKQYNDKYMVFWNNSRKYLFDLGIIDNTVMHMGSFFISQHIIESEISIVLHKQK